jgi:hypothetical protein
MKNTSRTEGGGVGGAWPIDSVIPAGGKSATAETAPVFHFDAKKAILAWTRLRSRAKSKRYLFLLKGRRDAFA